MPQTKDSANETVRDLRSGTPMHGHAARHVHEHGQEQQPREDQEGEHSHEHGDIERFDLIRIAVTAVVAALVWFRVWEPFPHVSVLGIAGLLFGGYPTFRKRSRTYGSAA
jgi:hypothetical protein